MSVRNYLSEDEIRAFESYVDNYALAEDGESRSVSGETLLEPWYNAKDEYLFEIFGNKLILKKDICYTESLERIRTRISNERWHSNSPIRNFIEEFNRVVSYPLDEALDGADNKFAGLDNSAGNVWLMRYGLRYLMSDECLASNIYDGENFECYVPNADPIKIQKGCKTSKAIGKIAKAFNLETYEAFRIALSMETNQKNIKGTMCLSIHPLDYATMSDNEEGWQSCMSWKEEGCYRMGTVEMMNSPMVVVAYIASNDNETYIDNNHYWNSKKWRQLFIVNDHMIGNVKAYPYRNDELTAQVLHWLRELVGDTFGENVWSNDIVKYDTDEFFDLGEATGYDERFDSCRTGFAPNTWDHCMYNDFSENQFAYVSTAMNNYAEKIFNFCYSGMTECMSCGGDCCPSSEGMLVCEDCECARYCGYCGERIGGGEETYWVDDVELCECCYENETFECAIESEVHLCSNMVTIFVAKDGVIDRDCGIGIYNCLISTSDSRDYYHRRFTKFFKRVRYHLEQGVWFVTREDLVDPDDFEDLMNYNEETFNRYKWVMLSYDETKEKVVNYNWDEDTGDWGGYRSGLSWRTRKELKDKYDTIVFEYQS